MATGTSENSSSIDPIDVPWSDFVRFIRQLSHDLRNNLNAAELQSAYLAELATDPELKDEIKRLRQMMSELGRVLQKLSVDVAPPKPTLMPYGASEFVEDFRKKLENDFPKEGSTVDWKVQLKAGKLEIDPQLLQQALLELLANAFRHQPAGERLKVTVGHEGDWFVFALDEIKKKFNATTENWGRAPLQQISHGHYGLGLNRARAIVESQGGQLRAHYDPTTGILVSTVSLPISKQEKLT